jgi:1-acyl-sn-glycerol-3-phosphate acyltransferase
MTFPTATAPLPLRGNRLTRGLARAIFSLTGWRIEGELPREAKFVVIVAPHTSNWDFLLGIAAKFALGLGVSWLGKHTLFRPPFNVLLRWLGGIPVDRSAPHGVVGECVAAFNNAPALVLGLAPEGTRKGESRWRTGFYQIAAGAGVVILPVAFDYGYRVVRLLPVLYPSGDLNGDLARLTSLYRDVRGKHPRAVMQINVQ